MDEQYLSPNQMSEGYEPEPVQNFAIGGIALPGQRAFLRGSDKNYLDQRAKELEAYEAQRQAYNSALTKYQEEVYSPYSSQYDAYAKAVEDWNAGPRTEDYTGPAEPTLKVFDMKAPELAFKEADVKEYQKAAGQRAQRDAASRAVAIDVASNPDKFNFGSMSVAGRFMAEGGPVESDDNDEMFEGIAQELGDNTRMSREQIMEAVDRVAAAGRGGDELLAYLSPESVELLKQMGGSGTTNPDTGLPEFFLRGLRRALNRILGRSDAAPAPAPAPAPAAAPIPIAERVSAPVMGTPAPAPAPAPAPNDYIEVVYGPDGSGSGPQVGKFARDGTPLDNSGRVVAVYGPDGTVYPSPAAARQAGVTNATMEPPRGRSTAKDQLEALPKPKAPELSDAIAKLKAGDKQSAEDIMRQIVGLPPLKRTPSGTVTPAPAPSPVVKPNFGFTRDPNEIGTMATVRWRNTKTGETYEAPDGATRPPSSDWVRDEGDVIPQPSKPSPVTPPPSAVTPPLPDIPIGRIPTPMPIFGQPPAPPKGPAVDPKNYFGIAPPSPNQGISPGTRAIGSPDMPLEPGKITLGAIGANKNLSPTMLGGQENAGFITDRLGNRIYAPAAPLLFAEGGLADVNAYNMSDSEEEQINTDPMGSAQKMMADLMGSKKASPNEVSVKRVAKSSGGAKSGKEMTMGIESLMSAKALVPELKGEDSARSQMEALALAYKLKAREAENTARGLMRNTMGAPTLEKPALTKNSLAKKRFAKGGEAKKSEGDGAEMPQSPEEQPGAEESSASRALKSFVSRLKEGAQGYLGLDPGVSGSDAYRTGQALGNMPGVGAPAAVAGIFIGKGAKGWNAASNALAKKITSQGASPEEVWKTTGNFKAPDGQWRQEISDAGAQMRESILQGPASRVLSHPELFENYPELGKIMTRKDPYSTRSVLMGGTGPDPVIQVGTAGGKNESAKGMLHEMQHAIQFKEGFGQGGSKTMAFTDPKAFEILKEVRSRMAQPASIENFAKVAWQSNEVTPEIAKKYQEYLDYHKKSLKNMDKAAQEGAAELYYKRLLGEAEARAVEGRKPFTMEQRLQLIPSQSYRTNAGRDIIPLDQLIVKRAEGSPKEGEVSQEELDAASRPAFVTPKSGIGRRQGPISRALNSGEAYVNMAKGVTELPYDIAGAPVDIATMALRPLGYGVDKPVMGSDWIKEKMTAAKVRPEPPKDATDKGFYTAGQLLSNLTNPAGVTRSGVRAVQRAGQAASDAAKDFQQYNRQLAVPGASYASRPEGSTLVVDKLTGAQKYANWIPNTLSDAARDIKFNVPQEKQDLVKNFWDTKALNYFSRQFGTEGDPVYRGIRDQTIKSPVLNKDFKKYVLDSLKLGKTRVNEETGQTRFFPTYPEAFDDVRKRYDDMTGIQGSVYALDPARVVDPKYDWSRTPEGTQQMEQLRNQEIDRMIAQGTPASQANIDLEYLTRGLKDPDQVMGPNVVAKDLLAAFEKSTGVTTGDLSKLAPGDSSLPQNLVTGMLKGEVMYTSANVNRALEKLFEPTYINQYLGSLPERELKNIRFEDAVKGAAKLSAQVMQRETLAADIRAGKRVPDKFFSEGVSAPLMQFGEGPLSGFAWKRIEDAESTVPEGAYVGHSVGGYAKGGAYGPEKHKQFNDGVMQVYTLRDNRNRPVNTIEVRMEAAGPVVTQIKGNGRATGNTAPVTYDAGVLNFLQNYLKPVKISESDAYLTPLLTSYRDQLKNAPAP